MIERQWLLIGGFAHGKKISVQDGGTARLIFKSYDPEKRMIQDIAYNGEVYPLNGLEYRIGILDATDAQLAEIPGLIGVFGLLPIPVE
jgi:hypothetical protein